MSRFATPSARGTTIYYSPKAVEKPTAAVAVDCGITGPPGADHSLSRQDTFHREGTRINDLDINTDDDNRRLRQALAMSEIRLKTTNRLLAERDVTIGELYAKSQRLANIVGETNSKLAEAAAKENALRTELEQLKLAVIEEEKERSDMIQVLKTQALKIEAMRMQVKEVEEIPKVRDNIPRRKLKRVQTAIVPQIDTFRQQGSMFEPLKEVAELKPSPRRAEIGRIVPKSARAASVEIPRNRHNDLAASSIYKPPYASEILNATSFKRLDAAIPRLVSSIAKDDASAPASATKERALADTQAGVLEQREATTASPEHPQRQLADSVRLLFEQDRTITPLGPPTIKDSLRTASSLVHPNIQVVKTATDRTASRTKTPEHMPAAAEDQDEQATVTQMLAVQAAAIEELKKQLATLQQQLEAPEQTKANTIRDSRFESIERQESLPLCDNSLVTTQDAPPLSAIPAQPVKKPEADPIVKVFPAPTAFSDTVKPILVEVTAPAEIVVSPDSTFKSLLQSLKSRQGSFYADLKASSKAQSSLSSIQGTAIEGTTPILPLSSPEYALPSPERKRNVGVSSSNLVPRVHHLDLRLAAVPAPESVANEPNSTAPGVGQSYLDDRVAAMAVEQGKDSTHRPTIEEKKTFMDPEALSQILEKANPALLRSVPKEQWFHNIDGGASAMLWKRQLTCEDLLKISYVDYIKCCNGVGPRNLKALHKAVEKYVKPVEGLPMHETTSGAIHWTDHRRR